MSGLTALLRDAEWLEPARLRRFAWMAAAVVLALVGADAFVHTRFGVVDARGEQLGRDFVNYWAGGRLAAAGHAAQAYDIPRFLAFERALTAPGAEFKLYSYPPIAMLWCEPLGRLPYLVAWGVWTLAGAAAMTALLRRELGWRWAAVAAVATPAVMLNAVSGQNGAFTALLFAGALMALERRPVLAGVLLGLLGFKPQLGVLIPVALLAGGQWRAAAAAAVSVLASGALSAGLLGVDAWRGFLAALPVHRLLLEQDRDLWRRIPTAFVAARLLGASPAAAYGVQAVSALAAAAATAAVWRSPASMRLKGAALMTATFLVTPYAWDYDMAMLVVAAVWLWREAEETGWRPWEKTALAALVALPAVSPMLVFATHLNLAFAGVWWVLALVTRRALQPGGQPKAATALRRHQGPIQLSTTARPQ